MGEMLPPPPVMRPPPPQQPVAPKNGSPPTGLMPPPPPPPVMRPPPPPQPVATKSGSPPTGMMPPPPPVMKPPAPPPPQQPLAPPPPRSVPPPAPKRPYDIPEWSHAPGKPYTMEVLKDGSILEQLKVSQKGAYMFGRQDNCDFVLDHPSISRYHAILQFNNKGDAFVFDLGSTHGTYVNKLKLKPEVHVPITVGSIIRFGMSSRLYVFQGPQELMPQEGPSRKDRHVMKQLVAMQSREDEEASLLRARLDAQTAAGASWGMGEDAVEAEAEEDELTWETYDGQFNERQLKTREQIQKRQEKLTNLKKEIDAIQAKEQAQGGLTPGQQVQVSRNEKRIEELLEQLENLQETLNDSIRESVRGKPNSKRKKSNMEDEDEDLSDDEFYDRTRKKQKKTEQNAETANSLLEKIERVTKEMEEVRLKLADEEEKLQTETKELEPEAALDSLDAFMTDVSSKIVEDGAARLRNELQRLQDEADKLGRLLKLADPSGEAARRRKAEADGTSEADVQAEEPSSTAEQEPSSAPTGSIWMGAPRPEEPAEEPSSVPVEDGKDDDNFVHYKDRKEALQPRNEAGKQQDALEAAVADDIALLLRHKKGLTTDDAETEEEVPEERPQKQKKQQKRKKKNKKALGPEPAEYMETDGADGADEAAKQAWVPPAGQTGDGKTALNEKFGY